MKETRVVLLLMVSVLVLFLISFAGSSTDCVANFFIADGMLDMSNFPRVLMSFFCGAVFGLVGYIFQSLFRNPLATPYTLGVSNGALFGIAIYFLLDISMVLPLYLGGWLFAFMGAFLAIFTVYMFTSSKRGFDITVMLLAGSVLSFLFTSLILFIWYINGFISSDMIADFMIGHVSDFDPFTFFLVFSLSVIGIAVTFFFSNELDLLSSGEDIAASRGVSVERMKFLLFFIVCAMMSGIVLICGPIGFVGLIAPHVARFASGSNHKFLIPLSALSGGVFLTICDTFANFLLPDTRIPTGVITAIIGGPFFIFILIGRLNKSKNF